MAPLLNTVCAHSTSRFMYRGADNGMGGVPSSSLQVYVNCGPAVMYGHVSSVQISLSKFTHFTTSSYTIKTREDIHTFLSTPRGNFTDSITVRDPRDALAHKSKLNKPVRILAFCVSRVSLAHSPINSDIALDGRHNARTR
eukprot:CAMPEP_0194483434 /NCGR_PEP_ID=MMETSP0253-20130528/5048_1 /TAXON_ID=2966 /ORGANISM="Noctiluca scintillans" /LENGTH=140 /DNA_ID=CAMNT_0039323097 /DNA_START=296 /DNA_END=718 /DNA_ORIENTATION=-